MIHDTPIGIALWSSQNTITRCTFSGCDDEGIVLLGTETNPCSNNTITSCLFHSQLRRHRTATRTHNLITNCTFIQNTHAGIDAIQAGNTTTSSTLHFIDNAAFGLYLSHSSTP
jgi:parallel beta-helix repeat protein